MRTQEFVSKTTSCVGFEALEFDLIDLARLWAQKPQGVKTTGVGAAQAFLLVDVGVGGEGIFEEF